jgi:hypothetical protein
LAARYDKIVKTFSQRRIFIMSRASRREIKKAFQKDIVEFLKVQKHFLPDLIKELSAVRDPRHTSYTDYDIEEILYTVIMKNVCTISSMQDMTDKFNTGMAHNLCLILWQRGKKIFLPHYVTTMNVWRS